MEISDYKKQKSTELWQRTRNQNATRILMQITKRQNSDQANYKRPSEFSYRFLVALKSVGDFKRVGRKQRVRLQLGKLLGNEMSIHG